MAEKNISTIQELAGVVQEGFQKTRKDIRGMKFDIRDLRKDMDASLQAIHADLIKHDERADKMIEMMQGLYDLKDIQGRLQRIREFIREQHGIEV